MFECLGNWSTLDAEFKLALVTFRKKAFLLLVAYGVLGHFWCSDKVFRTRPSIPSVGVGPTVNMSLLRNICNELECRSKSFSLVIMIKVRCTFEQQHVTSLSVNYIANDRFKLILQC